MEFTPTQRRIVDLLSDGRPHTLAELTACLADDLGPARNVRAHLTQIRKRLRPGADVLCWRIDGMTWYVRVTFTVAVPLTPART